MSNYFSPGSLPKMGSIAIEIAFGEFNNDC